MAIEPATPGAPSWRTIEHPELSQWLTHFVDRGQGERGENDCVPLRIRNMSAPGRLAAILWDGYLRAYRTFSQGDPAACFSETTKAGLQFLLEKRRYKPWALVVQRNSALTAGAGPVWYARTPEYKKLQKLNPSPSLRQWAVELKPASDWLHEREWRIIPDPNGKPPSAVPLSKLKLVALIVGDPEWTAPRPPTIPISNQQAGPFPPHAAGAWRYWWNPNDKELKRLDPLL
jgi:hypothetical protein